MHPLRVWPLGGGSQRAHRRQLDRVGNHDSGDLAARRRLRLVSHKCEPDEGEVLLVVVDLNVESANHRSLSLS